jgi:hypothetical protein
MELTSAAVVKAAKKKWGNGADVIKRNDAKTGDARVALLAEISNWESMRDAVGISSDEQKRLSKLQADAVRHKFNVGVHTELQNGEKLFVLFGCGETLEKAVFSAGLRLS